MCSLIPDPNERHQCYSVFGLDAQKMANYYDTVVRLEQQLSSDLDNPCRLTPGAPQPPSLLPGSRVHQQLHSLIAAQLTSQCAAEPGRG